MKQLFSPLQLKTASSIWQSGVKSSKRLVGLLVRAAPLIVGSNSLGWVKACFVFSRFVVRMRKFQGDRGLAIYLKTCNVTLLRYLGEEKRTEPRLVGAAVAQTRTGLPRVIPGNHRTRIRQGDRGAIRLWLGFFTLYRVLNFKGKMTFSTITAPGVVISDSFLKAWDRHVMWFQAELAKMGGPALKTIFVPSVSARRPDDIRSFSQVRNNEVEGLWCPPTGIIRKEILGYTIKFIALMTSSPNTHSELKDKTLPKNLKTSYGSTVSVINLIKDAASWLTRPSLMESFVTLCIITRASSLLFSPVWEAGIEYLRRNSDGKCSRSRLLEKKDWRGASGKLGKLALVEEPGKLRVVAMVDCLTQWLLYPLHRYIFDVLLKAIPQDGLYDQLAPVRALLENLKRLGKKECFSYDLSAATDRIPVSLQEKLLSVFTSDEFAFHWKKLLVERSYFLPNLYVKTFGTAVKTIKYAVGQPMGAYSSWAMLALVHHAIVQMAARRAKVSGWFQLYAILGDDVVIGHRGVALEYTRIMQEIGVKIGFNKSIVSGNLSLEFAKRFFYKGEEVTPLPLVGIACGWLGVTGVPEVLKASEARTGRLPSLFCILRSMGLGLKVSSKAANGRLMDLSKRARSIVLLITRPGGIAKWAARNVWDWYKQDRFCSVRPTNPLWGNPVMESIRSRIAAIDLVRIRKSLWNAFKGFHLDSEYGDVPELREWFEDNVARSYRQPMVLAINEFDAIKSRVMEDSPIDSIGDGEELFILSMFQALDTIEALAARLPTKVSVIRSLDAVQQRGRPVRVPKTLRMWRKVNKVLNSPSIVITKVENVGSPQHDDVSDWRKGRSDHQLMMDLHAQLMGNDMGL
nr:MAG: RNA-dependent RNA polymerase [Mitovirus sp.]